MKSTLIVSIVFALLALALNEFFFWGDWYSLIFSLLPGFFIVWFLKRNSSVQFIPYIIAGSVVYGFLAMISIETAHVLRTDAPFDWPTILQASLIFAGMSFLGGLVGIVVKGFTALQNKVMYVEHKARQVD